MKYLVSGAVDEANLGAVIRAFGGEVSLSALPGVQADAAPAEPAATDEAGQSTAGPTPRKKRAFRRKSNGNGSTWPAEGSIYDTVLKSLQGGEPKTPLALRDVLVAGGFSGGSINSALGRLEKAGKAKKGPEGWIAA